MFLFPGQWAVLGALALGAALLAALWPVRRLARTPPADLLKVFAHDR
jgi:putative ABC transport system permease protein